MCGPFFAGVGYQPTSWTGLFRLGDWRDSLIEEPGGRGLEARPFGGMKTATAAKLAPGVARRSDGGLVALPFIPPSCRKAVPRDQQLCLFIGPDEESTLTELFCLPELSGRDEPPFTLRISWGRMLGSFQRYPGLSDSAGGV